MLCLKCEGQALRFTKQVKIADGFVNVNVVKFDFCERWSGMVKTAQFTQYVNSERKTYNVLIDDLAGTAAMPNEVVAGDLLISAFGVDPDTGMRITTTLAVIKVEPSGFTDDGETPIPPTPDLYAQLIATIHKTALPHIGDNGNWWFDDEDTGVSALGEVIAARNEAVAAVEAKGAATLASIPADYTETANLASQLKDTFAYRTGYIVPPLGTVIEVKDASIIIPSLTRVYYGNGKTYRTIGLTTVDRVATSNSGYSEELLVLDTVMNKFRFIGGNAFESCTEADVVVATFKAGLNGNSLPVSYTDAYAKLLRPTDDTLSKSGYAADAKVVGEKLAATDEVKNAVIQAYGAPDSGRAEDSLGLIHFSDIHADTQRLSNVIAFAKNNESYVDDIVCSGDMVKNDYDDSYDWWASTSGAEKILVAIGNHDRWNGTLGDFTYAGATQAECFAKYIQPFYENWNVVHGDSATYYFKDYSDKKIRLVVMDSMLSETAQINAQNIWLAGVLDGARMNGLSVIIMAHYPPYPDTCVYVECNFTSEHPRVFDPDGFNPTYQATVQAFIDDGGDFICYLTGHRHLDLVVKNSAYPDQWFIAVDTASLTSGNAHSDTSRVVGTKCENLFNHITINAEQKLVKIVRIGADADCYLRSKKSMVFNYKTKEIISQN